ncbi:MAG: DUF4406 domain-containing protein [Bacteroidales bacterium]|nr:DUF4406 domain-containing protein [Bacteroidales bacterium]
MSNPKIYICGNEQYIETPEIIKLKKRLKALKCAVIVPSDMSHQGISWTDKLDNRVQLIKNSQVIYVLPNWKESIMARIELTVAMDLRLHTLFHPISNKEIKEIITSLDN